MSYHHVHFIRHILRVPFLGKIKNNLRYVIMSCPFSQAGGAGSRATKVDEIPGTRRELSNGAVGAMFTLTNGKKGFRIISGAKVGMRVPPRAITQAEAQAAFDKYYSKINKVRRGPRKGTPVFASTQGLRSARTYDIRHSRDPRKIITDSRYLSPSGPRQWDYPGVDAGPVVRKPRSAAQLAALARGRAATGTNRRRAAFSELGAMSQNYDAGKPYANEKVYKPAGFQQQGGYWW